MLSELGETGIIPAVVMSELTRGERGVGAAKGGSARWLRTVQWTAGIAGALLVAVWVVAISAFLGTVVVLKKGASKWGAVGAFVGGIVGAILGTSVLPVIGSVIFGLIGAFAGAVLAEYIQYSRMEEALRTGFWAFIGKLWAYFAKYAIAMAVLVIFIVRSWP